MFHKKKAFTLISGLIFSLFSAHAEESIFEEKIKPIFQEHCESCHGPEEMKSGLRVDQLNASFSPKDLFHWQAILDSIEFQEMPPKKETQIDKESLDFAVEWISENIRLGLINDRNKNGSIRRLTKSQYGNSLQQLLDIDEDFTGVLPSEGLSKEGFRNNQKILGLSPLQLEHYFTIASKSLDAALIDPNQKPQIQNFKVTFGRDIDPTPYQDKVVLGAASSLIDQKDFIVEEIIPKKSFGYQSFSFQTHYMFDEGYQGNATVGKEKQFTDIAHSVFAGDRGLNWRAKSKKLDHRTMHKNGILLRANPAGSIKDNHFKISVRELPSSGKFKITVNAARLENEALIVTNELVQTKPILIHNIPDKTFTVDQDGIYQIDLNYKSYNNTSPIQLTLDKVDYRFNTDTTLLKGQSLSNITLPIKRTIDKIVIEKIGKKQFLALNQVKVMQGGKNIVKTATITQSSFFKNKKNRFGPKYLLNSGKRYAKTAIEQNPWFAIEFKKPQDVDAFNLVNITGNEANLIGAKVKFYNNEQLVSEKIIDAQRRLGSMSLALVRLTAGEHSIEFSMDDNVEVKSIALTPLSSGSLAHNRYQQFSARNPHLAVQLGNRRDDGSSLTQVGRIQPVDSNKISPFTFIGSISNYSLLPVSSSNKNYLVGLKEIGAINQLVNNKETPRLLINSIAFEGPYYEQWPNQTFSHTLPNYQSATLTITTAKHAIAQFMTKAFRRPATSDEVVYALEVFNESTRSGKSYLDAIKDALSLVLTSPQFLFITENSASPALEELDQYELASKLSYFLWNSAPDHQLLDLASKGLLTKQKSQQMSRMINDDKFMNFTRVFTKEWLQLDKFDVVNFEENSMPSHVREQLKQEPIEFISYLIRNNLEIEQLINADFTLANDIVAAFYNYKPAQESGNKFVPIKHPNKNRAGILSQASILAGLSNGRESNPVKRGAWLARKIIDEPPPPPAPNVPAIDEEDATLSLAQKLAKHRDVDGCRGCHKRIDPWGLALEGFDAKGGINKKYDSLVQLPDGSKVRNFTDFTEYLVEDKLEQIAVGFAKHLATYAVGRSLKANEIYYLEDNIFELEQQGYAMQDILRFVVDSDIFMKK